MTEAITPPDNIAMFPGVRRERLSDITPATEPAPVAPPTLTGEMVLRGAIEMGITDVVVVGLYDDGSLFVSHQTADQDAAAGKLLRAANFLASVEYEDDFYDEDED